MGNSFSKKNSMNYKAITFWTIVGLLTLSFIIYVVVKFTERTLRPVENFDKVQVYGNDMYEIKEDKYFVYIYGANNNKNDKVNELEEHILNYLTFIKRNSKEEKAINLYTFNVDAISNARYLSSDPSTLNSATSSSELNINKN